MFTPRYGVFIPFVTLEQVNQTNTASRDVEAYYDGMSNSDSVFFIPTEELDGSYNAFTFGVSSVIRGGRERSAGGAVGGDIQAYINYKTITSLEGYTLDFYSFGLRYAF